MSREFGSDRAGYFDAQIECAARDCLGGSHEITRLWGGVLDAMTDLAASVASVEAGDSSEGYPIEESMKAMPKIEDALEKVKRYLDPFEQCMKAAVRELLAKLGAKSTIEADGILADPEAMAKLKTIVKDIREGRLRDHEALG